MFPCLNFEEFPYAIWPIMKAFKLVSRYVALTLLRRAVVNDLLVEGKRSTLGCSRKGLRSRKDNIFRGNTIVHFC